MATIPFTVIAVVDQREDGDWFYSIILSGRRIRYGERTTRVTPVGAPQLQHFDNSNKTSTSN